MIQEAKNIFYNFKIGCAIFLCICSAVFQPVALLWETAPTWFLVIGTVVSTFLLGLFAYELRGLRR